MITLTRPDVDVPIEGPFLVILQLLATLGLAELSYRYVETPFRRRKDSPSAPDWLGRGRPALAAAVILSVIVVGWGGFADGEAGGGGAVGGGRRSGRRRGGRPWTRTRPGRATSRGSSPSATR